MFDDVTPNVISRARWGERDFPVLGERELCKLFFIGFLGISDKRFYLKQKLFSPFSFLPSMHAGVLQNVRLTQVIF